MSAPLRPVFEPSSAFALQAAALPSGRLLFSASEVARLLGRSHLGVLRALERGEAGRALPPAVRLGRRWVFPAESLHRWAAKLAAAAESNTPITPRRGRPRESASLWNRPEPALTTASAARSVEDPTRPHSSTADSRSRRQAYQVPTVNLP